MRLNIYSQELILNGEPGAVEPGSQVSNTGIKYSFVRMLFHSSEQLHHPPMDDDRSAVTFWLPKSKAKRWALAQMFRRMAELCEIAEPETGLD